MPYSRPPLSTLKTQAAQDIQAQLPGTDPLLRFNNLGILGRMLAGLINLVYGYLDWIARMAVPWTALNEYLIGWGSLKNVNLKAATQAAGIFTIAQSQTGVTVYAGTPVSRGDNFEYLSTADATVDGGGNVAIPVKAVNPGALGNADPGVVLTLGTLVAGVQSSGPVTTRIAGGTDDETMPAYQGRVLQAYRQPPQGGAYADYIEWAEQVPGVTRAWCNPNGMGAGTVVVLIMLDVVNTGSGGFPVGTNGVAAADPRAAAATGDQLTVANYIYGDNTTERQPVTALVYVVAPTPQVVNFTIDHSATWSAGLKASVTAAINEVFLTFGTPGGVIDLSDIEEAIAAIPGTEGFVIAAPTDNITLATGALPVIGVITWAA